MTTRFAISARIKSDRQRLGLTQAAVSRGIGVSKQTYCAYEAGGSSPNAEVLLQLGELGFNLGYILRNKTLGNSMDDIDWPLIQKMHTFIDRYADEHELDLSFSKRYDIIKGAYTLTKTLGAEAALPHITLLLQVAA
jgi:transcriptional regulator with XRE-family HTH domain